MTLILALPAVDGAVLVSDTRKWFADGSHVDGHAKIARYAEGLVTGSGAGRLLDRVAAHSGGRVRSELDTLIAHTAALGILRDERAVWTLTYESCAQGEGEAAPSIGLDVFDGFTFRPRPWIVSSVPTGLSEPFVLLASGIVKQVGEGRYSIEEIRELVVGLYVDLLPSGLVSSDFDFGAHRPGRRLAIERVSCAPLLSRPRHVERAYAQY
jgi:hypothetical protein